MNSYSTKLVVTGITFISLLPFLASCGKDSDSAAATAAGRTMVVEVGDGQPGLRFTDETGDESDGSMSSAEIQECKDVFEGDVEGWKISGSENAIDLAPTQAFATKISGNQNSLNLTIKAKEGETELVSFPGLCLVLNGNQPSVSVSLSGVTIDAFKIVARGNNGKIDITLENGATLPAGTTEDLGKHVTVTVTEKEATTEE